MGGFIVPLTVMKRNSGFLVPSTTEMCTYNVSFWSKDCKLLGVTPGRPPSESFWYLLPQRDWTCLVFLSFSLLYFLPPSISLSLSIESCYTACIYHGNGEATVEKGSFCVKTCLLIVHPFNDSLWSDEHLCLRGLCLCIRNFETRGQIAVGPRQGLLGSTTRRFLSSICTKMDSCASH